MQVEVIVVDSYAELAADVTIVQVTNMNPRDPLRGVEYDTYCRLRGITDEARAKQDRRIERGIEHNTMTGTFLLEIGPSQGDAMQNLICGRIKKYPGALLRGGLIHANEQGFRSVVFALPDLMFMTPQYVVHGIGDEPGLLDVIKRQTDDPANKIEHLQIAVEYNTTLAHWLHVELGLAAA